MILIQNYQGLTRGEGVRYKKRRKKQKKEKKTILVSGALPGGHGDGELGPADVGTRRGSLVINE